MKKREDDTSKKIIISIIAVFAVILVVDNFNITGKATTSTYKCIDCEDYWGYSCADVCEAEGYGFCVGGYISNDCSGYKYTNCAATYCDEYERSGSCYCQATTTTTVINGVCGDAYEEYFDNSDEITSNIACDSGTFSGIVAGTGSLYNPWIWTCKGQNRGTDESCRAYKIVTTTTTVEPTTTTNCGNGVCDSGETYSTCPSDCLCGDGRCNPLLGESCLTCPDDCGCTSGECCSTGGRCMDSGICIGNDICTNGQWIQYYCGDGTCQNTCGETITSCPEDCGTAVTKTDTISEVDRCSQLSDPVKNKINELQNEKIIFKEGEMAYLHNYIVIPGSMGQGIILEVMTITNLDWYLDDKVKFKDINTRSEYTIEGSTGRGTVISEEGNGDIPTWWGGQGYNLKYGTDSLGNNWVKLTWGSGSTYGNVGDEITTFESCRTETVVGKPALFDTSNCGSAYGKSFYTLTSTNTLLCKNGVSLVSGSFQIISTGWTWKCGNSICSATKQESAYQINPNCKEGVDECWLLTTSLLNSHCIKEGADSCTCEEGYMPVEEGYCIPRTKQPCHAIGGNCKSICDLNIEDEKIVGTCTIAGQKCCVEKAEEELTSRIMITSITQQLFPCPDYGPGLRLEWEAIEGADHYYIEYREEENEKWDIYTNTRSSEYKFKDEDSGKEYAWINFLAPGECLVEGCNLCVKIGQVYNFRIKAQDENNKDITLWSDVISGSYVEEKRFTGEINLMGFEQIMETIPVSKTVGIDDFYINDLSNVEKHPIVLYTADEIEEIKERIKREPYSIWWHEIKDEHEWVLNYDIMQWNRIQKATYAKIMAFIYAITKEEKYGDKARDLLLKMNYGGYSKEHFEDIDSLVYFSEAYDMLKGANYNFEKNPNLDGCTYDCSCQNIFGWEFLCRKKCGSCEYMIREKNLKEQMKQVAETDITEIGGDTLTRKNNHHIRRYSAVGIAALVLNDGKYFKNVMEGGTTFGVVGKALDIGINLFLSSVGFDYEGVQHAIHHQIINNDEGGWREGPYYLRYSFTTGIPFMKAMKNAEIGFDWLDVKKLKNLFDWGIKIRMPNGARPPFDDSNMDYSYFFNGLLNEYNNAVYNWDWINSDKPYFTNDNTAATKIDAICYYDDSIRQEEPEWNPTQILPETGQIIFRSDWGEDAVYLAFLGENGDALDDEFLGYTHEHRDTMSFILYAYGKYLALDSGYIDWDRRKEVNKPENHNVVLIDSGLAEEGVIVEDNFFSTDYLDYGEIENDRGHNRGILFIDKNYFLVFDVLRSSKDRNYEWLLHGNGNFNEHSSRGREWVQGNTGLLAYVLPSSATITSDTNIHCNFWDNIETHTYMSVFEKGGNVGFLSLLYPAKNKNYPTISKETINNIEILKLQKDDWRGLAFVNEENKEVELVEENLNIKTDASKFFAKINNDEIEYIFVDDARFFYFGGKQILPIEGSLTSAVIKVEGENLDVYYK